MPEKRRQVLVGGKPASLLGTSVDVGDQAPDFHAVTSDLKPFDAASLRGKAVLLTSVPSLDTSVCNIETRNFSKRLAAMKGDVAAVTISMDLPFAQKRWCGQAGVDNVVVLSDHVQASFGSAYGVLIEGLRLLARAVWVLDKQGKVVYKELLDDVSKEPNYDQALEALAKAAG